jgi:hypothetical protein
MSACIPDSCNIAFKEWAAVCEALAAGRQTIILRKGGLQDDIQGARMAAHQGFWLYPTNFHQDAASLSSDASTYIARAGAAQPPAGQVALRLFAELRALNQLTSEENALRLRDFHIWSDATVRQRFHYRQPILFLLAVRVYALKEPILISESSEMAGCKSWLTLPESLPTAGLIPVLTEQESFHQFQAAMAALA